MKQPFQLPKNITRHFNAQSKNGLDCAGDNLLFLFSVAK